MRGLDTLIEEECVAADLMKIEGVKMALSNINIERYFIINSFALY